MKNLTFAMGEDNSVPRAVAARHKVMMASLRVRTDKIIALLVAEREKHDRAIEALSGTLRASSIGRRTRS